MRSLLKKFCVKARTPCSLDRGGVRVLTSVFLWQYIRLLYYDMSLDDLFNKNEIDDSATVEYFINIFFSRDCFL